MGPMGPMGPMGQWAQWANGPNGPNFSPPTAYKENAPGINFGNLDLAPQVFKHNSPILVRQIKLRILVFWMLGHFDWVTPCDLIGSV